MLENILKEIRTSFIVLLICAVLTGVIYPLVMTIIGQICFHYKANGSLISNSHVFVGSELIGQNFDQPQYFWGRPSATTPMPYNAASSGASNLNATNPALIDAIKQRIHVLKNLDPQNTLAIPIDLVTASGSGLDPEITPEAAYYQIHRIAKIRHLPEAQLKKLVDHFVQSRQWGILGEPRVNVLKLNLALNKMRT